jgi:hypothetical protein
LRLDKSLGWRSGPACNFAAQHADHFGSRYLPAPSKYCLAPSAWKAANLNSYLARKNLAQDHGQQQRK